MLAKRTAPRVLAVAAVGVVTLAACSDNGTNGSDDGSVELSFAHSYSTEHPHHVCGAEVVAEELANSGTGIDLKIFPNSQLGPDGPERVAAVVAGDISVDIQGASAISSVYEPIGALDAAYVFDSVDHMFDFADSPAFQEMAEDMREKAGLRVLDIWYFGMRHFTANKPIRSPEDFEGLRMRFPDSPQFLQNAEAIGANATAVAFEEVYLSLQQGVIDGQENPIPTISDMNFHEVQSHLSLTGHQTGFVVAITSEETWNSLSAEQQEALQAAISNAREGDRKCIEEAEQRILEEWRDSGELTIIEDVDRAAFSAKAEEYFAQNLQGDKLALYQKVRELAP